MAQNNVESPFPPMPVSSITIPSTPLVLAALEYSKLHTSPTTVNHSLRACAFALIIARKHPGLVTADLEAIVLANMLHDLGWATTKSLISADKRFEIDGANLARDFIKSEVSGNQELGTAAFDEHRLQLIWDSIALHTTPSISMHKQPEVMAASCGVSADFFGPNHPTGLITVPEYQEVVKAFPRLDFREEMPRIMCGLCETKPETTYDNFVGEFGVKLVPGYREEWEKRRTPDLLMGSLEKCLQWE